MRFLTITVACLLCFAFSGCSVNDCPLPWHDHGNSQSHNNTDQPDDQPEVPTVTPWSDHVVVTDKHITRIIIGTLYFDQTEEGFVASYESETYFCKTTFTLAINYMVDGVEYSREDRITVLPGDSLVVFELPDVAVDEYSAVLDHTSRIRYDCGYNGHHDDDDDNHGDRCNGHDN